MKYKTFKLMRKIFGRLAIRYEERILEKAEDVQYNRYLLDEENGYLAEQYSEIIKGRAQVSGKYAVLSFDMKESRKGYDNDLLEKLFETYHDKLKEYEEKWEIEIFHEPAEKSLPFKNSMFRLGDMFTFVINADEVEEEFYTYVFQKVKKDLGISYKFHYAILKYETDYIFESTKYYLMDAVKDSEAEAKKKDDVL